MGEEEEEEGKNVFLAYPKIPLLQLLHIHSLTAAEAVVVVGGEKILIR